MGRRLESRLSGEEYLLPWQRTRVQFPVPIWQLKTVTIVPEDLTPSYRQNINAHKIKINNSKIQKAKDRHGGMNLQSQRWGTGNKIDPRVL